MKRIESILFTLLLITATAHAGGLMTNTNYHIAFDRMMARGASFDIDAAYSNPAGLVWGHEGWQLSFNVQKPFQYRNVEATLQQPYASVVGFEQQKFKGKASANPFVPALFASYKHKNWAVGFMGGIVGSGGKVKFSDGVPMFVVPVRAMMYQNGLTPDAYSLDAFMEGKQYIYGIQANFTYRFNDHWSAAAGLRGNIYSGYNRGHVVASMDTPVGSQDLVNLQIDVDQNGFGVNPFLSVNYKLNRLVITGRYEFRSKLNIPNDTKTLSVGLQGQTTDIKAMAEAYGNVLQWMRRRGQDHLSGETQLMIAPGYRYRTINGLITNFHQPKSTLLLLVSAFIGEQWRECYRYALDHGFRFLSYGDCCLFLKSPTE